MKQDTKPERRSDADGLLPITGRHNPRLKELRFAFRRAELTPQGECAIEGTKLLEEALRSPHNLTTVFFSQSARHLAQKLHPAFSTHTQKFVLPDALFNSIVPSETPQGVAALTKLPVYSPAKIIDRSADGPILVAVGLQDPGNLGTIIRSAEAFGAAGIFLSEGTVSPYNSKVLRGSAGSIFRLPFAQISCAKLIPLLRARAVRLLATSSHEGTPLPQIKWISPVAIFIGNEGAGLPEELKRQMDEMLAIPQSSETESLNAGVAASIVMYEAAKTQMGGSRRSSPVQSLETKRTLASEIET